MSRIRKLEGFEDFLLPKKITQLLPAASLRPVIVLNSHGAGCDAEMLRNGKADASRAAYALHRAVQQLRLSGGIVFGVDALHSYGFVVKQMREAASKA